MKPLPILLLCLLLASCSAERRLQRLLNKHPELSRTDTLHIHDTITLPADTVWWTEVVLDTLTVETERIKIRIVRVPTGSPCDTVALPLHIEGIAKADTIYRTVTVEVPRIVPCPPGAKVASWWRIVALVLAGVVALLIYSRRP
jgi:hypothetical protein